MATPVNMAGRESGTIVKDHAIPSSPITTERESAKVPNDKASTLRSISSGDFTSESSIDGHRPTPAADESTALSSSDKHTRRKYNTSDTNLQAPSAEAQTMSQQEESAERLKKEQRLPWYKQFLEKFGSVMLENKASVARDHLALERTFLAWLRTSLSFASIGIAITQLFRLNTSLNTKPSKRFTSAMSEDEAQLSHLPFSPLIGRSVPAEMIPYIQQVAYTTDSSLARPKLGPTLLDQLLLLSVDGTPVDMYPFSATQLTVGTADKLRHVGKPLGVTFIAISAIILLVGAQRYFDAQHWIMQGKFPASRGSISLVAFVAFSLIIASLVVIIVISPDSYEK